MTTCIACGCTRVERKVVSVRLRDGRTVRGITAEVCPDCGERYYDLEAMQAIEAATGDDRQRLPHTDDA